MTASPLSVRDTARNWMVGARLKTLPVTLTPIAVGTAVAHSLGHFSGWRVLLTLLFALGFVLGTNFFNDYSDGVRGADDDRVGPVRLVGSGRASPRQVLHFGLAMYGLGIATGLVLAATVSWWMLLLTACCALGGWYYTGGSSPYGYRAFGEVSIFLFHGVIAVCATAFIQLGRVPLLALGASIPVGLLACSLLVTNNLRDIPTDTAAGKITLAVLMGDGRTRALYLSCVGAAFATGLALAVGRPWVVLILAALPFAVLPVRRVRAGKRGADLIEVLEHTCLLLLAYGALLSIGLAL